MAPTNREGPPVFRAKTQVKQAPHSAQGMFYREELLKHCQCLERQREYYSEKAITDVEAALTRLISNVDRLCARKDGDQLVSRLLHKIDGVTRLSSWSKLKKHH